VRTGGRRIGARLPLVFAVACLAAAAALALSGASPEAVTPPRADALAPQAAERLAAEVRVDPPPGWVRSARAIAVPGLALERPAGYVQDALSLRAVVGLAQADSRSLLPRALERRLGLEPPRPRRARFAAGLRGYRYRSLSVSGSPYLLDVFVAPTTAGVVTVACAADPVLALVLDECADLVAGVDIRGARPVAVGPDGAFESRVGDVVGRLDAERRRVRARLAAARDAAAQATVARELAAAYAAAAAALEPLTSRSARSSGAPAEILDGLAALVARARELAGALDAGDETRIRTAQRALLAAETRVRDLLAGLESAT
jgi:hypothetical protein